MFSEFGRGFGKVGGTENIQPKIHQRNENLNLLWDLDFQAGAGMCCFLSSFALTDPQLRYTGGGPDGLATEPVPTSEPRLNRNDLSSDAIGHLDGVGH